MEFAILRTTRRSGNPDKNLPTNIKGCIENGILKAFYKYSYALTNAEAQREARGVVEVLKMYGVLPSKDVVVWMDVEDKSQFALSAKALTEIVDCFKEVIVNSGYSFGLYMGKYAYEHKELYAELFNDHIWLARYPHGNPVPFGTLPNEKYKPEAKAGQLWGWQYSSKGQVLGIRGNVDLDVAYYDIRQIKVDPEYYDTPEFTLIDSLNKIGADSSYNNRKKIAIANGITNYSGTSAQNLELLQLLNAGNLKK